MGIRVISSSDLENLDKEVEDAHCQNQLLRSWHIPGITIHISTKSCMVMVPILSTEIVQYSDKELDVAMAALTLVALKHFKTTEQYKAMEEADGQLDSSIVNHKNDEVELGGYRFFLPECSAERPAFVARITQPDQDVVRLLYFYPAMGLNMQHTAQQMLLGRTGLPVMAACLLKACIELMGHTSYTVRTVGCSDSTLKAAVDSWALLVKQLDLPESSTCAIPALPTELVTEAQNAFNIEDCYTVLSRLLPGEVWDLLRLSVFQ